MALTGTNAGWKVPSRLDVYLRRIMLQNCIEGRSGTRKEWNVYIVGAFRETRDAVRQAIAETSRKKDGDSDKDEEGGRERRRHGGKAEYAHECFNGIIEVELERGFDITHSN